MRNLRLTLVALLVCFVYTSSAQSGSGSGSGNGELTCEDLACSHGCNNITMEGPVCYCPTGYILGEDDMTCQVCSGGYWGMGCANQCQCGCGNPCNNVDGTCICNSCFSGAGCETPMGSTCFLEFLRAEDKTLSQLTQLYGGVAFPCVPNDTLPGLITTLMDLSNPNTIADEIITEVSRVEGPLAKLTWTVDFTVDRPTAERALADLEAKVKLGELRITLIVQVLVDLAYVTINAGTKV